MKNYHLLLIFICALYYTKNIFSCPCKPSNDSQPFFEQYDVSINESEEENVLQENNEKEFSS